jgi:hypothetical protein
MNKILEGMVEDFSKDFGFTKLELFKKFEYFSNYSILSKLHPEAFDDPASLQDIDVDNKPNDISTYGIDAIAIVINGNIITKKEEIESLRKSKSLDINIIFIQTKISEGYNAGNMNNFVSAVENYLSRNPNIAFSESLKESRKIYDEVFKSENSRYLKNNGISVSLYYVTSGKDLSDDLIKGVIKQSESRFSSLFEEVKNVNIYPVGADFLIDAYKEASNSFSVEINFKNCLPLDKIPDIEQSYLGYLNISEFFKLIIDEHGFLRKKVFYENVRDFQGSDNRVNEEIDFTVKSSELNNKFILLNNGVTIVARGLQPLGNNNYEIRDYQIVNGCQTSHVLYHNRKFIKDNPSLLIPVKIIYTLKGEVINTIIKATNRQTPVPDEAFVALEKFHKRLQDFYLTFSRDMPIKFFYERRSREYSGDYNNEKINKNQIINLHSQIRSYSSIVLSEPHIVYNNNPASILRSKRDKIFLDTDRMEQYYISSFIFYRFNELIADKIINEKLNYFRYYICLIFKVMALRNFKITNEGEAKILNILKKEDIYKKIFLESSELFENFIAKYKNKYAPSYPREFIKYGDFKDDIFNELKKILFTKK